MLAGTALALLAGGCTGLVTPKDIYGYKAAESAYGAAARHDGRLEAIRPLDPGSSTPLLTQLMTELEKTDVDRRYLGVTYDLTTDNLLNGSWLVQTPNAWGMRAAAVPFFLPGCTGCDRDFQLPACSADAGCAGGRCGHLRAFEDGLPANAGKRLCLGQADPMFDAFYNLIVGAQSAVDVAVLEEVPDIRFLAMLRNAVTMLARSGRTITVRVLVGQYPPHDADTDELVEQLTRDVRHVRGARLQLFAGAMRSCAGEASCGTFSWNHSKIVAVDGRAALVGGHNMWTRDYLANAPVHDVSMRLQGGAAADAHHFLDVLWGFTCARRGDSKSNAYRPDHPYRDDGCLAKIALPAARPGPGHVPVAAVARLGSSITDDFADQTDVAEELMFGAAQHVMRVSQQDLGFSLGGIAAPVWPEALMQAMADLLALKHGEVYVVLSQPGAVSAGGNSYSNGVALDAVVDKLKSILHDRGQLADPAIDALLCRSLHVAPLRFGPDSAWPDDYLIANHAKVWIIDDRAFYIGSHNLYPVDLQEFGYIVEARRETAQLLRDYWTPLWRASSAAAISGADAPGCVLNKSAPSA